MKYKITSFYIQEQALRGIGDLFVTYVLRSDKRCTYSFHLKLVDNQFEVFKVGNRIRKISSFLPNFSRDWQ